MNGRCIQELVPSGQGEVLKEKLLAVKQIWQPVQFEFPLEISQKISWFSVTITPMPERSLLWVGRDITRRKQAEQDLHSLNANLEILVDQRTAQLVEMNQALSAENDQRKLVEEILREAELRATAAWSNKSRLLPI